MLVIKFSQKSCIAIAQEYILIKGQVTIDNVNSVVANSQLYSLCSCYIRNRIQIIRNICSLNKNKCICMQD